VGIKINVKKIDLLVVAALFCLGPWAWTEPALSGNTITEPTANLQTENQIDLKINEIKTAGQSALKAQEYFNTGKYVDALTACEVVLKINPGDQKINQLKQSAMKIMQLSKQSDDFYSKGEYQKSYDLRGQILQLNAGDILQKNLLQKTEGLLEIVKSAQNYFDQAQYQLAVLEYEKIIKKNPGDQVHPLKIALCQDLSAKRLTAFQHYEHGRYAEAKVVFEELFSKNPAQTEYGRQASACAKALEALTAGDNLLAQGQLAEAKDFFIKAKEINAKDENLLAKILLCDKLIWWMEQSRVLQQGGFFEEALQNWKGITSLVSGAYYQKQFNEIKKYADWQKQISELQKKQNFKAIINLMDGFKDFYFYKKRLAIYEELAALQQKGETAFAGGEYAQAEKYFSELKKKITTSEKVTLKFSAALKAGKMIEVKWQGTGIREIKSAWLILPGLSKIYFSEDQTAQIDLPRTFLPGYYLAKIYLQGENGQTEEDFKVIQILE
jgi:tetratricopeptide (TPR) repeat protein